MSLFYIDKNTNTVFIKLSNNDIRADVSLEPLNENTSDGATEKHLPLVKQNGAIIEVSVGEIMHPMEESHFITTIFLETTLGFHSMTLTPGSRPEVSFYLADNEKAIAVYEYCNLHGLWKQEIK